MRRCALPVGTFAYLVGLATIGGSRSAGDVVLVFVLALTGVLLMLLGAVTVVAILDRWDGA